MRCVSSRLRVCVSVFACLVLSAEVSAATVTSLSGHVSINRGSGFTRLSTDTSAKPGNRIMVGPSGSAEIVYDDGCRENVNPGSVVTVAQTSPCQRANANVHSGSLKDGPAPQAAVSYDHLLLGAAVVAGGVGAAIYLSGNDNNPASP
jgi:hypothetical protein